MIEFLDQLKDIKDKLALLRACVILLEDLEGTIHNEFAGKVLLFLAKSLPLFDQSGLNLKSEFSQKQLPKNVSENLKKSCNKGTTNGADMEEGETLSDDESDNSGKIDIDNLYDRFWRLQQLMYQPNQMYDKNTWFSFRTYVDAILTKFEMKPTTMQRRMITSYLTETKAFGLQIDDINTRRAFLVQLLIVLQYLEMPSETKPESFDKIQLGWSTSVVNRIYTLLNSMPNSTEGRDFLALVRNLLRREKMWIRWKNEKCKEPAKVERDDEVISMRGTYQKKRKLSDEMKSAKLYNMHVIGSQNMSRLWNLKSTPIISQPDLLKYIDIPQEKQTEKFKDPNYSFGVLRLLRKNAHFFEQTSATIQSLDLYLKTTTGRILQQHNQTTN